MSLSGTVAVVTGAASGLGRATALKILRESGRVLICDLPAQVALAEQIVAEHAGRARFAAADVASEDSVRSALDEAREAFGEEVNAAVNCAGVAVAQRTLSKRGPHPLDDFRRVLEVNTVGSFNVMRLAAERMAAREACEDGLRGVIVNTASVAAFDGQIGQAAYAASKGAVVGMTLPVARDLSAQGIRVCTVAPGLFRTPLLEGLPDKVQDELAGLVQSPKRLGDPAEFADLVAHIISNSYMNGETIRCDGGLRMPP